MNDYDKKYSPSFCVYPWLSIMVNTSGTLNYCCIAKPGILRDEKNRQLTLGNSSLAEGWNSPRMRALRDKMYNGGIVNECEHCFLQEKVGKKSFRQMHNEEWTKKIGEEEIHRRVKESIVNEWQMLSDPIYLDLRLSNLCNLKCRMCSPHNSSQIAKEHKKLYKKNDEYTAVWGKTWGDNLKWFTDKGYVKQFYSDNLWKDAYEWMPNLRKIYITGGEPTLIKHNVDFLQACADEGYGDQIEIFLNTNCTNINEAFLEVIKHFKNVLINASLDGIGATNEYIRYPSNWEELEVNYKNMLRLENVSSNATPVLQLYNLHSIHEVLHFCDEVGDELYGEHHWKTVGVDILINTHPNWLDVRNLPVEDRQECKENLLKFKDDYTLYDKNWVVKNSIDGIVNYLDLPQLDNYKENLQDFLHMTKIQDETRSQNFGDLNPDLYDRIEELVNEE
jgi:pyruvate-formate lyase-activating enzyme